MKIGDLVVESIITSFGGQKSLFDVETFTEAKVILDKQELNLLSSSIAIDKESAINSFINLISNDSILSDGISELTYDIVSGIASLPGWKNNNWLSDGLGFKFDFYEPYYSEYLENDITSGLIDYNTGISALSSILKFSPIISNCLIEPMKIIFNFGTKSNDYLTNNFDLDIKVRIDDNLERIKPVGWKCGYKETKYLNWLTNDNTTGRTGNCIG